MGTGACLLGLAAGAAYLVGLLLFLLLAAFFLLAVDFIGRLEDVGRRIDHRCNQFLQVLATDRADDQALFEGISQEGRVLHGGIKGLAQQGDPCRWHLGPYGSGFADIHGRGKEFQDSALIIVFCKLRKAGNIFQPLAAMATDLRDDGDLLVANPMGVFGP
jgi:hypothetical protein